MTKPQDPDWPDSLDAMTAAPEYHEVLLENDRVRVLDSRVAPGATTPVHTHEWPGVLYVLSWSDFNRYDRDGKVRVDSRKSAFQTRLRRCMIMEPDDTPVATGRSGATSNRRAWPHRRSDDVGIPGQDELAAYL